MHDGTLSRQEIQTWVCNRYYYQTRIPIKDGSDPGEVRATPQFRREWIQRIHDHDGARGPAKVGSSSGLRSRIAPWASRGKTRLRPACESSPVSARACDDVRSSSSTGHDILESVAASLTEMFAGDIMKVRIAAFEEHYPWVSTSTGCATSRARTTQAPRDAEAGGSPT